jgi:hypothetical protein
MSKSSAIGIDEPTVTTEEMVAVNTIPVMLALLTSAAL